MTLTATADLQPGSKAFRARDGQDGFYRAVGRFIREFRVRRGLSQSQVAEHIGMTFQQVQKYESGVNRIPLAELFALSDLLGFDVADLVDARTGDSEALAAVDRHLLELSRDWSGLDADAKAAIRHLARLLGAARQGGA